MKNWFQLFHQDLTERTFSTKLIAAGSATPERALQHYRFQHGLKLREATQETFPTLVELMGADWEKTWKEFRLTGHSSPRSLDRFSKVFLDFFLDSRAALHFKELARFEYLLDIHPWTHEKLDVLPLPALSEETKLEISPLDFHHFKAPVMDLYLGNEANLTESCTILFWYKETSVHFRRMEAWELEVLKNLSRGFGTALEHAPEDETAVSEFFQWLGTSGIVRGILH